MRSLPPLNSLRAFEAAARHLSFTKAAAELNVTPAAISHQVKSLEDFLGVVLFRRLTRALRLTDVGQAALPKLRDGFDSLGEAVEILRRDDAASVLTVSVSASFGAKWLVPRLDRFRAAHPDLDIRIDANDRLADFRSDNVDVALRYGKGGYAGMRIDKLTDVEIVPVCSPLLLGGERPLREPQQLSEQTLLHLDWTLEEVTAPSWRMWLLAAGLDSVDATRGPRFSMESMLVQAAMEGQGVALAKSVLVADDIAAGRLVMPFDLSVCDPLNFSYYLVSPLQTAALPKIAAFRAWVLAEAAA